MAAIRGCEICKKPIDSDRAANDPKTRLCIEHAREIAKYGGEFFTIAKEERSSKPGSLKINVSGVSTELVRNEEAIRKLRADFEARR